MSSSSGSSSGSSTGSGSSSGTSSGSGSTTSNTPSPTVTSITPPSINAGSGNLTLTVNGTNFTSTSIVEVNGTQETTTYASSTKLTATVPANQLASGAQFPVFVLNGSTSSTATPVDLEVDNPAPVIQSVSPTTVYTGSTSSALTVTGSGFVPTTTIFVNGTSRTTTYVSAAKVSFALTSTDLATAGNLALTAVNSAPGGGTSSAVALAVLTPPATPVITSITPSSIPAGSPDTYIGVEGTGFTGASVVQWNGTALNTSFGFVSGAVELSATVPQADLTSTGTATVTVNTPGASPATSNSETVTISNPPAPTLTSISPSSAPINTPATVDLTGTGFTTNTTVALNGVTIPSTYVSPLELKATFPASSLALPGNVNVTVTTPAPGGGTSTAQPFTTFLAITSNDIVYNSANGLIYASLPIGSGNISGNTVVAIDPLTGLVTQQIFVGSDPNQLTLSTDGTQLFVGLDGAGAVAQVNLTTGKVVDQFQLGGGSGIYNPPYKATYLAAVPGSPNSVAVVSSGNTGVAIYDSGVVRPKTSGSLSVGQGPISFGSSASTLYMAGSAIEALTVDSTGITAASTIAPAPSGLVTSLQYDSGRLYLSTGAVYDATSGAVLGTFYSAATTPASGPTVSDSTLGRAFVAQTNFTNDGSIAAFDESSFNLLGTIPVNGVGLSGYPDNFRNIIRWGQNGIALNTSPSVFSGLSQIFIFQSPLVKDLASSPADLSAALKAPTTATTGTAISWTATVINAGPNSASGATLALDLDSSLIINSVTATQGSCSAGPSFSCNLGTLASGATATVTVSATPTIAGTFNGTENVSSTSYDPTSSNNRSSASLTVTGNTYGAVPAVSSISPNFVQAGSTDFTLTVTGTGFNPGSTVNLGTTALSTTYVSATQLTAQVTADQVKNYGWAAISVSNPAPGGGVSQLVPLTIYDLLNVPASNLIFDPYSQLLYATIPGSVTTMTGNSLVSINPYSGSIGTPIAIGSQPTVMAETGDGNYLYVGLSGANSIAQFDLLNQSLKANIPLQITSGGNTSGVAADWLAAMPGTDTTLAINLTYGNSAGNFGIFDISGSTGKFRTNFAESGEYPVFADSSNVYSYDYATSGAEFYRYSVDSNGLTLIDGTSLNGMGGTGGSLHVANGLVYGGAGGIANPSTTPPTQVATLPLTDFYGAFTTGPAVADVPAPSLQKEFLMIENTAGTWAYGLARYNLNTYDPEAYFNIPASLSGVDSNWTMLRFGQDGLALLAGQDSTISNTSPAIVLIRGPFVAPQELQTQSAATLASSSASTIAHGSGNTILTLTGSNFLPGVAVTWNGSYRTTSIVDSSHVTVDIPASDLAAAGSATLVATNPGAPASNSLTITIQ